MADKFNIRLNIVGKTFPLSIDREKEEIYRRAEREVNDIVTKFRTRFRAEEADYLAMAALQVAVANVELEMSRSLGDEVDQLMKISDDIDRYLSSVK